LQYTTVSWKNIDVIAGSVPGVWSCKYIGEGNYTWKYDLPEPFNITIGNGTFLTPDVLLIFIDPILCTTE
jgi:hypothetical protein